MPNSEKSTFKKTLPTSIHNTTCITIGNGRVMSPGDEGLVVAQPVLTRASPVINTAKVNYDFDFWQGQGIKFF